MSQAARTVARLARKLECATDLSLSQYRVLSAVDDGGERATQLARALALAKPTVTAAVDGLVERGLLAREAVPGDRRSLRIALTPVGAEALADAEAAMGARLAAVTSGAGDEEGLLAALTSLGDALDRARATAK